MNKTLLIIGTILAGIALFVGGLLFGRTYAQAFQPGWMMGSGNGQVVPGMMGGLEGRYGVDMMSSGYDDMMENWNGQPGAGMMNFDMMGMMMNGNMMGNGMMAGFSGLTDIDPLSIKEAETAVNDYLATLDDANLTLGEIMIFDNHAYAQVIDESSETGAFEVLVDPTSGNVFPEPGPNMMWNTEYGMMAGFGSGMMGGEMTGDFGYDMMNGQYGSGMMDDEMMGDFGYAPDAEINVTADEAVEIAQVYLDAYLPGKTADDTADAFPGYYTLHVLEDGETIGMLSVNAYTSQVFLHHWHGDFLELVGEGHE